MSNMSEISSEVFNKDTFLTALQETEGTVLPRSRVVVQEPAAYVVVKYLWWDNLTCLEWQMFVKSMLSSAKSSARCRNRYRRTASRDLPVWLTRIQIGAVLNKQEQDFLAAYRAHMYNVQKDVHDLKKKLELSETSDQKSEKLPPSR